MASSAKNSSIVDQIKNQKHPSQKPQLFPAYREAKAVAFVDRLSIAIRMRKEQWELKKLDIELGSARDCRQIESDRSLLSEQSIEEEKQIASYGGEENILPPLAQVPRDRDTAALQNGTELDGVYIASVENRELIDQMDNRVIGEELTVDQSH